MSRRTVKPWLEVLTEVKSTGRKFTVDELDRLADFDTYFVGEQVQRGLLPAGWMGKIPKWGVHWLTTLGIEACDAAHSSDVVRTEHLYVTIEETALTIQHEMRGDHEQ